MAATPNNSTRPYADLIHSTHGASQSWLVNFLRTGYYTGKWESLEPHISISILDSVDGVMSCQDFRPHRTGEVDAAFRSALSSRPPESKTRLVLVQGGQLGDTNAAYIDAIGWQYRLDPKFFCTHFQDALYITELEGSLPPGPPLLPALLPYEKDYITVVTNTLASFATAAIITDDVQNTIVMIGLDQFFDDGVTFLRKALVNPAIFSRTTVLAADLHPCDFLVPYINSSLRSIAKVSRRHGRMEPKHASEQTANSFDWEWNQANYRNLMRSCGTISQYLEMKYPIPSGQQPRLAEVIRQYSALIAETRENAGQLQTRIQNYTSGQAILEARKGIEQANAVRRITIVGIVFIPLSFATSFFGMNFEQLGTGTLHIGFFVLTAVLSGAVAWALAASITSAENGWNRARKRYGEREGLEDDYEWVTKTTIVWSWLRRHFSPLEKLYEIWRRRRNA